MSISGRIQLVKLVIFGMIQHIISIYNWPSSVIKEVEKYVRNFIWSGDVNNRKLVIVAWYKVWKTPDEWGLSIRSMVRLNKGVNLELCWDMLNSSEDWALLIKSIILRNKSAIKYHIFSSIWRCVKEALPVILENSLWLLGKGNEIIFWTDEWCDQPLTHLFSYTRTPALKVVY